MSQANPSRWDKSVAFPKQWRAKRQPPKRDPYEIKATQEERHTVLPFKRTKSAWGDFKSVPPANVGASKQDIIMSRLGDAAEQGDERTFINIVREVEWASVSAEAAARAISLALKAGTPTAAQHIYGEAMKYHSDSPDLQKYARLFAPTRHAAKTLPPNPTLRANREWLKNRRAEYRGQWIAIRNGELLATATTLDELTRRVGDVANVLLTKA